MSVAQTYSLGFIEKVTLPKEPDTFVMQHAKIRLFSLKCDSELLFYSTRGEGVFSISFDILFIFLGHTNPKLWV